jgi:hypothetical protein
MSRTEALIFASYEEYITDYSEDMLALSMTFVME